MLLNLRPGSYRAPSIGRKRRQKKACAFSSDKNLREREREREREFVFVSPSSSYKLPTTTKYSDAISARSDSVIDSHFFVDFPSQFLAAAAVFSRKNTCRSCCYSGRCCCCSGGSNVSSVIFSASSDTNELVRSHSISRHLVANSLRRDRREESSPPSLSRGVVV